ncbi:MAG: response regulator [Kofleriaceae bacterium]
MSPAAAEASTPPDPAPATRRVRVLFVDDDTAYLRAIRRLLRPGPELELLSASDGETARRLVDEACPDLLVLDVYMPDLDGIAYCRQLKRDPRTRASTILVVSAAMTASLDQAARVAGAAHALDKVADLDELFRLIRVHPGSAANRPTLPATMAPADHADDVAREIARACSAWIDLDHARHAGRRGLDLAAATYQPASGVSFERLIRDHAEAQILEVVRTAVRRRPDAATDADDPRAREPSPEFVATLRDAQLPTLTRLVLAMRDAHGFRIDEIAAALQLPVARVREEHARGWKLLLAPAG